MNEIAPTTSNPVAPVRADGDLWSATLTGFWTTSAGVIAVAGLLVLLSVSLQVPPTF